MIPNTPAGAMAEAYVSDMDDRMSTLFEQMKTMQKTMRDTFTRRLTMMKPVRQADDIRGDAERDAMCETIWTLQEAVVVVCTACRFSISMTPTRRPSSR